MDKYLKPERDEPMVKDHEDVFMQDAASGNHIPDQKMNDSNELDKLD